MGAQRVAARRTLALVAQAFTNRATGAQAVRSPSSAKLQGGRFIARQGPRTQLYENTHGSRRSSSGARAPPQCPRKLLAQQLSPAPQSRGPPQLAPSPLWVGLLARTLELALGLMRLLALGATLDAPLDTAAALTLGVADTTAVADATAATVATDALELAFALGLVGAFDTGALELARGLETEGD